MNAVDGALELGAACEPPRPKRYASLPTAKPTARPVMSAQITLLLKVRRAGGAGGAAGAGSEDRSLLSASALSLGCLVGRSGGLPRRRRWFGGVDMSALSHLRAAWARALPSYRTHRTRFGMLAAVGATRPL